MTTKQTAPPDIERAWNIWRKKSHQDVIAELYRLNPFGGYRAAPGQQPADVLTVLRFHYGPAAVKLWRDASGERALTTEAVFRAAVKNPDAVKRGARGGKMRAAGMTANERAAAASKAGTAGGRARAKNLTKQQRAAIAKRAAAARWKTPAAKQDGAQ